MITEQDLMNLKRDMERIVREGPEQRVVVRVRSPEKAREYTKRYRENNKEKILERNRRIWNRRYKNDPQMRLASNLRARMHQALRRKKKHAKTIVLLGCSFLELKAHLESLFLPGMTWENHGQYGWHIDHIRPCASFDLTDQEQQKQCFHYTNLQPLWWKDNLKKSKKVCESQLT